MKLSISAISDPSKLAEIQNPVDQFISRNSDNPFMLSVFIQKAMETAVKQGSFPEVLVFSAEGRIVSLVPLLVKRKFGLGFASLLYEPWFSPDFISEDEYSQACIEKSMSYIFDHLQCQFETLDLPGESTSLAGLETVCIGNSLPYFKKSEEWMGHCIMLVDRTWDEFQKTKNRDFRRRFKRIERQLDNSGTWKIEIFTNGRDEQTVLKKIMDIEQSSWKQNWRSQNDSLLDEELMNVWEASCIAQRSHEDFSRSVWFLELNGKPIAYTLVLQYKGKAYTCKTSFNEQFRKLSPGIFLKNVVLRDLFSSGTVKTIDFMTNLPFQERWTRTRLSRVEFTLSKGVVPKLLDSIVRKSQTKMVRRLLPKAVGRILN